MSRARGKNAEPEPNIVDVAQLAGVSTATVSRVLNGNTPVAAKKRLKVEQAIAKLGYEPNNLGRNMRTKRLKVFGLVIPDVENPFFTAMTRGVEDEAQASGFGTILCNSDEDPVREANYLAMLRAERVSGLIVAPTGANQQQLQRFSQLGSALVTVDRRVPSLQSDEVMTDNTAGTELAIRHLHETHAYESIGMIGGPEAISSARERESAFRATLAELGIAAREDWIVRGDMREPSGHQVTKTLLGLSDAPRAVFVVNNLMTLGALRAAKELGLAVPGDVALIGFDDTPWAPHVHPPLTVVAQPTYEIGQTAARLLIERVQQPERAGTSRRLMPTLVVRGSCGCT